MSTRSQPVICVDFGLDRLTVLQVDGSEVTGWAVRDLPSQLVRNGDPVDPGQVAELLRQTLRESGLVGVRARFTLPDEAAVFRLVELPAMPRRHLQRALRFMVDKEVPLPLDRIAWDWDVLEKTDIGYRICLVAAWRDVIDRVARVATEAGLQLELVEPRSLATARALDRDQVVVFDGSRERLQALYLKRGALPYVDQAPIGRDPEACARTLERLLRRGLSVEDQLTASHTVVLGGDLEDIGLPLSMTAISVTRLMGDQPRLGGAGSLPAGSLLANLGLADGVARRQRAYRPGIADVNLMGNGGAGGRWFWLREVDRTLGMLLAGCAPAARRVRSAARSRWSARVKPRYAR